MAADYDAIVVGARCAGAPTAMLLARKGYRVLVVDRATFPSDTVSTHVIHAPGVAALQRWGLLDEVIATGCPPIETLLVRLRAVHDHRHARVPATASPTGVRAAADRARQDPRRRRRSRRRRGARAVHRRGGRRRGRHGRRHPRPRRGRHGGRRAGPGRDRRRRAQLPRRQGRPARSSTTRSRCSSGATTPTGATCPSTGSRSSSAPIGAGPPCPTNDGLTLLVVGWPYAESTRVQGRRRGQLPQDPRAGARSSPNACASATREERFIGAAVPNFFRKPYGPGWALVGDAGYNKDPITAQGISDAFRDAELCADRPRRGLRRPDARSTTRWPRYQRTRDDARAADLRVHDPAGHARTATRRDAAAARRRARQPGRRWTPSSASPPAPSPRSSSSTPPTSAASWPPVRRMTSWARRTYPARRFCTEATRP